MFLVSKQIRTFFEISMYGCSKMHLWYQVVDARAGPGMKSMMKVKSKNKRLAEEKLAKKKKFEREYSPALSDKSDGIQDAEIGDVDYFLDGTPSNLSSRTASPGISDGEEFVRPSRRHKAQAKRRERVEEISGFIDLDFWKQ